MKTIISAVMTFGAAMLFAGTPSDDFVNAAHSAYAKDANCNISIFSKFAKSGVTDDQNPGRIVKWVSVKGARNVRDIGGWTGLRTGMIYRGTELEKENSMRERLDVKTEFDLRGATTSKQGKLIHHAIGSYMDIFTYNGEKTYGAALKEFARPEIYPVYIHCAGGADRTGTLCFLIETLCGVSLADARADYELTGFSPIGARPSNRESVQPFATMVRTLSTYPGATFKDKVAYYAEKVLRLTPEEINAIRANLTEPKATTADFRDDPAKYWNVEALKHVPSYRKNPYPESDAPDMKSLLVKGKGPNDSEAEFFCLYAVPTSPKPAKGYPCLLLVHGGGGTAYPDYVNHFRKNGFAVLAVDWYNQRPRMNRGGKGSHNYDCVPLSPEGRRNDQRANIANLVIANSLLRSMPEVDASRNVYVGLSWGSWYGAAVAGVDDRFSGVVEIYCGDAKPSNREWLVNGRFLHRAKMPVWWVTWTQDDNVDPYSSQAGWNECPTYWGHATCPTLGHSHYGFILTSVMRMAKYFAGMGPALPRVGTATLKDGVLSAPVISLGEKTGKAFLVYTDDAENVLKASKRIWRNQPATFDGKTLSAKLPKGALIAYLTLNEEGDEPSQQGGSSSFWFK